MMKRVSIPLLSIASLLSAESDSTNYSYVEVEYKGSNVYKSGEKVLDTEYVMQGVSGMTYDHIKGHYYILAEEVLFQLEFEIEDDNTVQMSQEIALERTHGVNDIVFVDDATQAPDLPLLLFARDDSMVWANYLSDKWAEDVVVEHRAAADLRDHAEIIGLGAVAGLKGAEIHYVVHSVQTEHPLDLSVQCPNRQCVRIVVSSVSVDRNQKVYTPPEISHLYSLRYDMDESNEMGIADITLFEDVNQVLHAIVLEKNRKLYLVTLSGDNKKADGAKDISSCEPLTDSTSCFFEAEGISKRELYSFDALPDDLNSLSFQSLAVLFRGDLNTAHLVDEDNKMVLVAANNNAGTDRDTNFVFVTLDTSHLDLELEGPPSLTSAAPQRIAMTCIVFTALFFYNL